MFLANPNPTSLNKVSNGHSFITNGNALDKKNALFHLILKDNLQITYDENKNGDILQKLMNGLFTYLYSDEDANDIENKEKISDDVMSLIEEN